MTTFDPSRYGASGIVEEYDDLYVDEWDTSGAVDRLVELADGRPVLEFGIGTGRIAIPLVERGVVVHGVDGSQEMLSQLRRKPGGEAIPVSVGDFSSVRVPGDFGLVALVVNTIFALPDQAAQVALFANAARHLPAGGRFVIEAWIPDLASFHDNRLLRPRVHRSGVVSMETVDLDPVDQVMRTTQVVFRDGTVRLYPANHRYAWPAELDLMAQLSGFDREHRWQDWRGTPFSSRSSTHVTVYRLELD